MERRYIRSAFFVTALHKISHGRNRTMARAMNRIATDVRTIEITRKLPNCRDVRSYCRATFESVRLAIRNTSVRSASKDAFPDAALARVRIRHFRDRV